MPFDWINPWEQKEHEQSIMRIFGELKSKKKINANYIKDFRKIFPILSYVNFGAKSMKAILENVIAKDEGGRTFNEFVKDVNKYGLDEIKIMNIYATIMFYQFLSHYSALEAILISMLLGVKYGKKNEAVVSGRETLGKLICVMGTLYPQHGMTKEVIDIDFRKTLAHGWYYISNSKLIYYKDGSLQNPQTMDIDELFTKFRKLHQFVTALITVIVNLKLAS